MKGFSGVEVLHEDAYRTAITAWRRHSVVASGFVVGEPWCSSVSIV